MLVPHGQQCDGMERKFFCRSFCQNGSTECPAPTDATGQTNSHDRGQAYRHATGNTVANPLVQLDENRLGAQPPPGS
jgi:hypothetical protein